MTKLTSLFAALLMASTTLLAETVNYIDANGQSQSVDATEVISSEYAVTWGAAGQTTWYVVTGSDVTLSQGAICEGAVNLILADGAKLTATGWFDYDHWYNYPGIQVSDVSNSLTIYGQAEQTGQLIANGADGAAGIGGGSNGRQGTGYNITINGGRVTAIGGSKAAGIGNGEFDLNPPASNIKVATFLIVKEVNSANPTNIIENNGGDLAEKLAGKQCVTIIPPMPAPANNQIFYQSSDHQVVTLNTANYFGVTVTSNTYDAVADYGVITFSGELTTIGTWGFQNRTNLTTIVWPNTVTSIGESAFQGCTNLSSIDLQEGVTSIGIGAFASCAGMAELTIPSTVTSIGESAFTGWQNLTKLTVKAGGIERDAFNGCKNLSSIDLQEGVTSIGRDAFHGCAGQAELILPSTITSIGLSAFAGWQNLTKLIVKAGDIGESAFSGCTNLSSIDLQEGVTSIRRDAFNGCAGMAELTIPSTVDSIGRNAFYRCKKMKKLIVKAGSIGVGAFEECTNLSSIDLQEGVTSIGGGAFFGCTNIAELIIPSTVTSIGEFAFAGCINLEKLTIKAEGIGYYAFSGCTKLSSIDLQEGVTSIGDFAFSGCAGQAELTIPSTVTSIGVGAFNGCTNVTSVIFLGTVVLGNGSLNSIGTAESPVALKIPSTWLANDKPVNSTTPWHGGYFNCTYEKTASELLGSLAEPCDGCHAIKVTKGDTEIILYAPNQVEFLKTEAAEE